VNRHRRGAWLARGTIGVLAALFVPGCGPAATADPESHRPAAPAARRALEQALGAWRDAPQLARTVSALQPVMFVDQQRRPEQRLRAFTVLGESPEPGAYRRFRVRLALAAPDESVVASYYVFGQGPFWVYRAEDLDMLMHMDHAMMAASSPEADVYSPSDAAAGHAHGAAAR
jgi:hypothetical protein